jgi:hypothetical protein
VVCLGSMLERVHYVGCLEPRGSEAGLLAEMDTGDGHRRWTQEMDTLSLYLYGGRNLGICKQSTVSNFVTILVALAKIKCQNLRIISENVVYLCHDKCSRFESAKESFPQTPSGTHG